VKQALGVKARDLMRTDVATLEAEDTIESALELFEDSGISGAPVLQAGRLVGMLTLADLGRTEHVKDARIETKGDYEFGEPVGEELGDELDPAEVFYLKEGYSPEVVDRARVVDWMSPGVITVSADDSIEDVCDVMVKNRIHRVCVLEAAKLVGLITSFDVVRHVARGTKRPAEAPPRRAATKARAHRATPRRR
jgi:CBS domain-containing protein